MIREIAAVTDVKFFCTGKDVVAAQVGEQLIRYDASFCEVGREPIPINIELERFGSDLYCFSDGKPRLFERNIEHVLGECCNGKAYPLKQDVYFNYLQITRKEMHCTVYKGQQPLWERTFFRWTFFILEDNLLFHNYFDGNLLVRYDVETGEVLWSLDVTELGRYTDSEGEHAGIVEMGNGISLYQNVLLVPISNSLMLGLDTATGQILWQTKIMNIRHVLYQGRALFLMERMLMELDALTGAVIREVDLEEYLKLKKGIGFIAKFKIIQDRIYFTDYKKMRVGVLDYQTLELLDLFTINHSKDGWQIGDLEVFGNKILLLEYLENMTMDLHVLEDDALHQE